ncbi:hypothetical protein VCHA37P200_100080 [Vibrio chagasii]|nr:hypothetical protein VCHA53O468_110080 [Vibrio chagasii]CAH6944533.1 hypothetical protein VCHA55O507_100082 [Vibrio chagasii]CAH7090516.1 hypothetical protein VCHA37P200_100080 [Vibrio chagasii]CAH7485565.1 hypothetical protein VCHA43P274_90079 [Vibrio chagasii]
MYNHYSELLAFAIIQASFTLNIEVILIMYNSTQIVSDFTSIVSFQVVCHLDLSINVAVCLLLISSRMKSVDLFVRSANKTIDVMCSPKVYSLPVSN